MRTEEVYVYGLWDAALNVTENRYLTTVSVAMWMWRRLWSFSAARTMNAVENRVLKPFSEPFLDL